jgi:hypothetical protein
MQVQHDEIREGRSLPHLSKFVVALRGMFPNSTPITRTDLRSGTFQMGIVSTRTLRVSQSAIAPTRGICGCK